MFSFRDARSFSDVLGNSSGAGKANVEAGGLKMVGQSSSNAIVIPERTLAFNELFGVAVVGRTVDLETLVDLDKLLKIAKVLYSRIQYLGGLSIIISFKDESSSASFLNARVVWGPWFSKLEAWKGQSLSLERVAWLNVQGIPLHLVEEGVFNLIGEMFGKVLYVPKRINEELNLSMVRVGVLAGEAQHINEPVSLSWKDIMFRVWVEEEKEAWQPDCLGSSSDTGVSSDSGSPVMSSPIGVVPEEEVQVNDGQHSVGEEQSPRVDEGVLHGDCGSMHEERENKGEGLVSDDGVFENGGIPRSAGGSHAVPLPPEEDCLNGGPVFGNSSVKFNFLLGSGDKGSKAQRKAALGPLRNKGRPAPIVVSSPGDQRPRKRCRNEEKDIEPGFGFVGFTSRSQRSSGSGNFHPDCGDGELDLNVRVASEDHGQHELSASDDPVNVSVDKVLNSGGVCDRTEKEVESTVCIGQKIGVDLHNHSDFIRQVISYAGINGVSS
ncbi:hypothetical protein HanRHA438_Chr15g0714711 [Helianthus annuus]|nr:hypothetical protein HanHA300_Chr15g0572391 [Helianthus annuus]KAJ0456563.1 hypothetical protein HanIR_Chr15g0763901 [Helianthus annuus]KAJ0649318.1 hypothetical protein HanLR1_Chr15g0582961 [Helianthus annuus]KAJ0653117.1 hypothetical protein HanOQP8_Chr15g0579961 [Helianthus annuus]KAJ0832008.1 hypothetical protein HanPSC8_Chr15g0673821 [Helianthus annuus]